MMTTILKNLDFYISLLKKVLAYHFTELENFSPKTQQLIIIEIGDNKKEKEFNDLLKHYCNSVGFPISFYWYPDDISEEELFQEIEDLQEFCAGLVLPSVLPDHLDASRLAAAIRPDKDVCGLRKDSDFDPPMAMGILQYLKYCGFEFEGKDVVIIGRGNRVGKPLAARLIDEHATVTVCHSKSKLPSHIYHCDLIICATGNEKVLDCAGINVPVITVGKTGSCYNVKDREVVTVTDSIMATAILDNVIRSCSNNDDI